jgi:hypothetical protein
MYAKAIFNYRGSDLYDSTIDEGCIQCPDLHCPPGVEQSDKCYGWQENCGSSETSTGGKIDDVITSCIKNNKSRLNGTGFTFGPIQKSGLKNKSKNVRGAPIVIDTDNLSIELTIKNVPSYLIKNYNIRTIKPDGTTMVTTTPIDLDNTMVYKLNLVKNGFLQIYRSKDDFQYYMRTQDFLLGFKNTGSNKFYITTGNDSYGGSFYELFDSNNNRMPVFLYYDWDSSILSTYSPYFELKNGDLCLGTSDNKNLKFDKCDSSNFSKNFLYITQLSSDSDKKKGGQYSLVGAYGDSYKYYCIDLPGGDQKSGKTIKLYECHDSKSKDKSHQQWDLPYSDGRIKYTNSKGGEYWFFNNNSNLTLEGSDSAGKPQYKFTRNFL